MKKLKYLSRLSESEIKSMICEKQSLGIYSGSSIVNCDGEELLVVSTKNNNFGEISTTHYIYNDYQLLQIVTKHDYAKAPEFNLPISSLKNANIRNKTRVLLRTLCNKFKDTSQYFNDSTSYYNGFESTFEKLNTHNQQVIERAQNEEFGGNLEVASNAVTSDPQKYGYIDFYKVQKIAHRLIEDIFKYQAEATRKSSNGDESGDGEKV